MNTLHTAYRSMRALCVRPIHSPDELDYLHRVVHDSYVDAGLINPQPDSRLCYCEHLERTPKTTVLVAEIDGEVVGTTTLTLDGPDGFHLDDEYSDQMAAIRQERRRLAASWRMAVCAAEADRARVLLSLIRANQSFFWNHDIETCLFTVIPHLEPIYRRIFHARSIARSESLGCTSASLRMFHCRTILMRWDAERCPIRWRQRRQRFTETEKDHANQL